MKRFFALVLCVALLVCLSGCGAESSDGTITLTIWHVYGGQTDSPLNDMIDEFNSTVGREKHIRLEVTLVSTTNSIHDDVLSAANRDPGAADLPDLFVSYPKTVLAMPDDTVLVDFRDYFTEGELGAFVPDFLAEGVIRGRQVILPIAKSTEILFVNKTAFDRYAAQSGAALSDLTTWEGLYRTACDYAAWTDAQTPEIPDDPKAFFVHDYHFNYFQVGVESLGESFFDGDEIAFGPAFSRAWEPYARAAISGGVWLQGGYATEPLRTGDAVASVASSASILYYSDRVTYPDNTSEEVEILALPCPMFEGGEHLVMQRGAGICLTKSTPEREQAAVTFLKWLTEPAVNTRLVTRLGYMPVQSAAFDRELPETIWKMSDPKKYVSLYDAYMKTYAEDTFYHAPQLENYLALEIAFEQNARLQLLSARREYLASPDRDLDGLIASSLETFRQSLIN
jgi:multiple sugar transport system substrate-binding protein